MSFQAIYVPADDLTDPAPATTFAHLDATTVLSRGVAERDIYPAVDPPRLHLPYHGPQRTESPMTRRSCSTITSPSRKSLLSWVWIEEVGFC